MKIAPCFQTASEHRLLARGIFENTEGIVSQAWNENVGVPVDDENYPKAALGVLIASGKTVLEGSDALLADIFGDKVEPPKAQSFARTVRDVPLIVDHTLSAVGNLLTLHPLKATKRLVQGGLGVLRLPTDIPLDIVDDATGISVVERRRAQTHDQILALAA